jgi:cytochrome b6-f complex iron-sulfur subunit
MRSVIWTLEPSLPRERVESLLGALAARGVAATLREAPGGGRAVLVPDPPEGLDRPEGVIRTSLVEVPDSAQVTRRTFLDSFALGLAAATAGTGAVLAGLFAAPPERRPEEGADEMEVGTVPEIEARGSRPFRFGREPCVVVASGGRLFALSTVCTHLGCLVRWDPGSRALQCPCHRAAFDLEGNVLEGPPPRPLRTFTVSVQGERVLVRRRTAL